ncbi:MAG: ATP-binding protein [Deltaproteobacteria bacterium]|nr:ATP-binding protein [Deltaproteobacteria bacterium]
MGQFPAVLVTGPRQAGKTTLLQHEAGDAFGYVSFDDTMERSFALTDPNGFFDRFGDRPVILDEIQYVPELLPSLKLRIDRNRHRNGRWLLTGSQQFHLMRNVSESLAGRIAILDQLPFSIAEQSGRGELSLEQILWNGCYPEPALNPEKRELWLRAYIQTYLERDVRQLQNIRDLRAFEQFVALACARHSQEFNSAFFSRETGVTLPTAKSWAGLLEASYLLYLLPPFFNNLGKRITKAPKLYMLDPAIVAFLTRQPSAGAALAGAMGGALFEGLLVVEAVKAFTNRGLKPALWYWRSHDGLEVDLILQRSGKLVPVEIKLTTTPLPTHLESLKRFRSLAGEESCEPGILVCRVTDEQPLPFGIMAVPWQNFPIWLARNIEDGEHATLPPPLEALNLPDELKRMA